MEIGLSYLTTKKSILTGYTMHFENVAIIWALINPEARRLKNMSRGYTNLKDDNRGAT